MTIDYVKKLCRLLRPDFRQIIKDMRLKGAQYLIHIEEYADANGETCYLATTDELSMYSEEFDSLVIRAYGAPIRDTSCIFWEVHLQWQRTNGGKGDKFVQKILTNVKL